MRSLRRCGVLEDREQAGRMGLDSTTFLKQRILCQIGRGGVRGHSTRQESPYILRVESEQLGKTHAAH